jgi:glycosyltransferase involved in cell wall biosynthesis
VKESSILILTYWSYKDALIQTYTLPYVKLITKVSKKKAYIVCLEQKQLRTTKEERIKIQDELSKYNISIIFFDYNRFGFKQVLVWCVYIVKLVVFVFKRNIEYIHCWCTPAAAIGYFLSKLTGKTLIIDSYEPHAESMIENGEWLRDGFAYKILFWLERLATKAAAYFIATTYGMRAYALSRYKVCIPESVFFVKPACVDLLKFQPNNTSAILRSSLNLDNKIVCVYAGKLGGIYLDNEVFDFVYTCYRHWGDQFKFLMLSSASKEIIFKYADIHNIPSAVIIHKSLLYEEVPQYMALGDFALNPVKPIYTKRFCTSIKDGEYWAMGLPVVITKDISDDSEIIATQNIGYVLNELTVKEYRNAVIKMDSLLAKDKYKLKNKIRQIALTHRDFKIAEEIYSKIYS